MEHLQADGQRPPRLRGAAKMFYLLGVEAQALADHLDEVPNMLAEIEALEDEAERRRTKVVVEDTVQEFCNLGRRLNLTITKLSDLVRSNDPLECVPTEAGKAGTPGLTISRE